MAGLVKEFGNFRAVDGVVFQCHQGEVFGLLGPNGAGKTTVLRTLATSLKPTGGAATVAGYDIVAQAQEVRRHIGVLPSEPGLYGRLTAAENLRFYGGLYGVPEDSLEERINQCLDLVEMLPARDKRTEGFSKGMKQKIALARAILHRPPVLLLDEPTSGLDVMSTRAVREFIRRLAQEGTCILFSSHIMSEAEAVCDRLAVIASGRIRATGTAGELKALTGQSDLEEAFVRLATGESVPADVNGGAAR